MSLRLLLADDHRLVRESLRALLEREGFEVVADVGDGRAAVRMAAEHRPDVAVLDIGMPLLNGVDGARRIREVSPRTKVVLLTMHAEDPYVAAALRAGVKGFLLKTQAAPDLVRAIQEAARGNVYLGPEVSRVVVSRSFVEGRIQRDPLTPREREVLQLIAEGKATKQVATVLGMSPKTAESHRTRIMGKLEVHGVAGLVRYAIRHGLVSA